MTETIPHPRATAAEAAATGLLVLAPLRLEASAVRRGLRESASRVLRTGMGAARAARVVKESNPGSFGAMIVMGTSAGVDPDLKPGDLVVATEVSDGESTVPLPGADLLAAELRRAGLPARAGRLATVPSLVKSAERARLAAEGYLAADMETSALLGAANGRPAAVIRAVSDSGFGPGMVAGGIAALRSLRLAAPVAERWAAACAQRTVLLAGPRSFCAGVERAIEIVERALELRGAPVYVRKQIVHNTRVVSDLEQRGAVFVDELDEVPDGATVVFSAHGVSPAVRDTAAGRGLSVIDATCPLVSKVHAEARRFAREGYTVALIGHAGHEEVEGTLGEAPDSAVLVQTAADVAALRPDDESKVAYLMQTTLAVDEAADVAAALRERFPGMRARQRRHLLRDDQQAGGGACRGAGRGPRARRWFEELVQLGAAGRAVRAGGHPGIPDRRRHGHRLVLVVRSFRGRPHGGRVGAPRGGRGDHRRAVRAWHRHGDRADHHN
jgi:4-hydroxy-3-methylbut-2-en-1-yl diphosphate reductase